MKNANQCTKKLTSLIKKLPASTPPEFPDGDDPIVVLVQSFLMWEASTAKMLTAYPRILESVVDFNDLRVSMPFETADMIGTRYPRALERCERLRATLREIYLREHAISFESLRDMGKRDIKKYLESLDGITPYIASRVLLIAFEVHGIPVDEQLRARLVAEGAATADQSVGELANWLSRHVKAEDSLAVHFTLQAWMDGGRGKSSRTAPESSGGKKKSGKKSTVKNSAMKAAN